MKKARKHYTPPEKVAILRWHLVERVSVSDLCDQYHLRPTLFYNWQKQFFENGAAAFERSEKKAIDFKDRRIATLESKLQRKNEVVAELMEEHVQLKKRAWGTLSGAWVPHDTCDAVIDYVNRWSERTELPTTTL
jgi:transposase-like protein